MAAASPKKEKAGSDYAI